MIINVDTNWDNNWLILKSVVGLSEGYENINYLNNYHSEMGKYPPVHYDLPKKSTWFETARKKKK